MRKLLLLSLFAMFLFTNGMAQVATWNYDTIKGPSAPLSMAGADSLVAYSQQGSYYMDEELFKIAWPFDFQVYGNTFYQGNDTIRFGLDGHMVFMGTMSHNTVAWQIPQVSNNVFLSFAGGRAINTNVDPRRRSKVNYKVSGTGNNQVLTIAFSLETYYKQSTTNDYYADIQIQFYQADGRIVLDYNNVVAGTSYRPSDIGMNSGLAAYYTDFGAFPNQDTSITFIPSALLSAPQSFNANTASSCQIDLSWTKNSSGNDVMIAYNTTNSFTNPANGSSYSVGSSLGSATILYVGSGTSTQISNLPSNAQYYFKIWSKSSGNNYSTNTLSSNATTNPITPSTSFSASASSSTQVDLSWLLNTYGDNVMVTYNTVNSFATPQAGNSYSVGSQIGGQQTVLYKGTNTSFSHTSLSVNTTYYYRIYSYGCQNEYSTHQAASATTTTIGDPSNLQVNATSSCATSLTWSKNATNNDVIILRNTTNTFATPTTGQAYTVGYTFPSGGKVIYNSSGTSTTETALLDNTSYYYKAFSVDASNNYSGGVTANATTPAVANTTGFAVSGTTMNSISLGWALNAAGDNVIIAYNTSNTFSTPVDGATYNVGNSLPSGQGTILYNSNGTSTTHNSLPLNSTYYYKIWSYDCGTNYSSPGQTTNGTTSNISNPTSFTASASSTCEIDLSWVKSNGNDVMILMNTTNSFATPNNGTGYALNYNFAGNGGTVVYNGSGTSATISPLNDNATYYFKAFSKSASYSYSTGVTVNAATPTIANTTGFAVSGTTTNSIDLSWVLNAAGDNVIIAYNTSNNFVTPIDGSTYTVGSTLPTGQGTILYNAGGTSTTHSSLSLNTTYYYKIWSYDCNKNYSSPGQTTNGTTSNISNPTSFAASASASCEIDLSWVKSGGNDVMILMNTSNTFATPSNGTAYGLNYNFAGGGRVVYNGAGTATNLSGLMDNTTYYFKAFSKSSSNFYSSGVTDNAATSTIANTSGFAVSGTSTNSIDLSWVLNGAGDDVIIAFNTTNNFANPVDGMNYTVGSQISSGQGTIIYNSGGTSTTHSGLNFNTTYYYKIWSYDCGYNYSSPGQSVSGTTSSITDPQSFSISNISSCKDSVYWTKNTSGDDVMVVYNTTNNFTTPTTGVAYNQGYTFPFGNGTVAYVGAANYTIHSPLFDGTKYYYMIFSKSSSNYYSNGILDSVTTMTITDPATFTATANGPTQIDLAATGNSSGDDIIVAYNTINTFATPIDGLNYNVGWQIQPGQGIILYKGPASGLTNHIGLNLNSTYYYKVWSYDCAINYSSPGKTANATTGSVSNPQAFSATAISPSQITLNWTKNAANNDVMIAYNTVNNFSNPTNGITYGNLSTLPGGNGTVIYNGSATTTNHTGLNMNTVYFYKIWSKDASGNYSSGIAANDTTFGVEDPTSFTLSVVSANQIDLSWAKNALGDSVIIVWNTVNDFAPMQSGTNYLIGNQIAANQGTVLYKGPATSFDHSGLTASTKYYYMAFSYDASNNYSSPGLLDSATTMAPGIATFPYLETFDTQVPNQGNLYSCQTYYPLTSGWNNTQSGDDIDWVVRQGTTPSGTYGYTGPAGDHTTGNGYYLYTEANSCYNKEAWLISPVFNFTSLSNPRLEFYYFMLGTGTGTINVQISTNGGSTWSTTNLFNKQGQQQSSQSAAWGYADISLQAYAGMTDIRLRIKGTTGFNYASDMAIDDIRVYQPQNMALSSIVTEQDTVNVVLGASNQQVIRVNVNTVGAFSPLSLGQIIFNTTGTQSTSDLTNAKVFYTGTNPSFSATQQFGSAISSPNGTFPITGSQVLGEGNNYFWLTYDISSSATIGNKVDAQCMMMIISGINQTPSVTNPTGDKTIVGQVTVGTGTTGNWRGPVYPSYYHGAHEAIYLASELGTGAKEFNKLAWYKTQGTNVLDELDDIKIYMKNGTGSSLGSGSYSLTGYTLVYQGVMPNHSTTGWMEMNLDNSFLWDGSSNLHVLVLQTKPANAWTPYPYYAYTTVSPNKARYVYNYSNPITTSTNLISTNQRPNIRLEYELPTPMSYSSSEAIQPNTSNVTKGASNVEIIGIRVETNNTANPLNLSKLLLSTQGTTSASDITSAKIYYTGSNPTFATTNQFGSTVSSPSGSFAVTGSQTLVAGSNYFWVAYDLSSTATVNNTLDATCDSITLGGTTYAPSVKNPNGSRTIKEYLIIGTGTTTSDEHPLHRYYYHKWEGIYTSSEMGTAKDLSALAFYKASGSNVTNQILNVTIYVKHTSASTVSTGTVSTSGYTQVYQGNFPNNAVSGWMEVPFDQNFSYNGTDNLSVLVVQSYGAYFFQQPNWAHTITTTNRARWANSYSSPPTTLTANNRLANVRFEYSDPSPMSYVSSTVTQNNTSVITAGINNQEVIGIEVVTNNSANPLSATSFTFSTAGSSAPASDIIAARVFYTGGSSSFSAINQFGTVVANPNGTFTVTGSQTLTSGTNYFWLAYDIPSTATSGNWVDASCTSLTVGTPRTPTLTSPIGNRTIVGALSGEYTIGTGGDYTTFTSAVNDLNNYGVAGWVKFKVLPGTYNEQISLSPYTNASAANTVTFESSTGDSSDVTLSYASSSTASNYTLQISGAQYYIIKNMSIKALGSTYGRALVFDGTCSNIDIRNCVITNGNSTSYNAAAVYAYNNTLSYINIINNNINGPGAYGLYMRGSTGSPSHIALHIDSNIISTNRYPAYLMYHSGLKFRNNEVSATGSTYSYALYSYYNQGGSEISGNHIISSGTSTAYGIYMYGSDGTSSVPNTIYNNFIAVTGSSVTSGYGIYFNASDYVNLYHNNINFAGASGSTNRAAVRIQNGSNINLVNNMIVAYNGGRAIQLSTTGALANSDYNNLFSTGILAYYGSNAASNLAAWKTYTGEDANSISSNPSFSSTTNLHVTNVSLNNLGTPIAGITIDIDGDSRDATNPDIGADEFSVDIDGGISAVVSPVDGCNANQPATVTFKNFGQNTLTSATINWELDGVIQSPSTWTGSITTGQTANVNLGNLNLSTGSHTITAWSSLPNGIADQMTNNDTLTVTININAAPIVNAGADTTICTGSTFTTNASATGYSTLTWSSSGSGAFINGGTLTATYTPSAADITTGSVYLKLSASSAGCGNIEDSLLLTIQTVPTLSFTGLASTYCPNDAVSTLVGTPTGGVFSGPGVSGNSFDPGAAGSGTHTIYYKYTVGSCKDSVSQTTTVSPTLVPTISGLAAGYCISSPSSTLTGTPAGGTWSGAITSNVFNPATVGIGIKTVTYTVVDGTTSCSFDTTYTTEVYSNPVATIGGLDATYCSNDPIDTLTGSPMGGTFTGNGMNGNLFNPATAGVGTHTIEYIINSGPGCSDTASQSVTVNAAPNASFSGLASQYCSTDAAATLVGTPSGGTFSGSGVSGNSFDPSTASTGQNWITYSFTNGNGCTDTAMQAVQVNETPVANAGPDLTIINGADTILYGSATGGSGSYAYSWTPVSEIVTGEATNAQPNTVNLTASQTYTLVVTDNASGCSSSDQMQVNVTGGIFGVTASSSSSVICEGDSVEIQALASGGSGSYSYLWNSTPSGYTSGFSTDWVKPSVTTTYTVLATDGISYSSGSVVITVNPAPTVSLSGLSSSYCSSEASVNMVGTPNGGVFAGIGVSGNTFNPSTAGSGTHIVTYTYTNINGCSGTDTATVLVNETPMANAGADNSISYNTSTTLNGSATGGANYAWLWSPSSQLVSANVQNPTTVSLTATQQYVLNVEDTLTGCNSNDTVIITVTGGVLSANATATNTTICEGNSTQLNVLPSGGDGTYTYSWTSSPSGFTSTQKNPTVSPTVTTTYTVSVSSASQNVTDNVVITVNPTPTVNFTGLSTSYCVDELAVTLSGSPSGGIFSGNGITGSSFDPAVAGAGTHNITYTYTSPVTSCVGSISKTTTVNALPVVNAGSDINLTGPGVASLSGSASGGSGSFTYLWSPQALVVSPTSASTNTVNLTATTQFTLIATDNTSLCAGSDDMFVNVGGGSLTVSATASPDTVCAGSSSTLNALASGGTVGSYTYAWSSNPAGFTSTAQSPSVTPSVTTTYTVTVNDGTSNATNSVVVTVNPLPTVSISNLSASYCSNGTGVLLIGSPTGGTFSGTGVTGSSFNPKGLSQGSYNITYNYTDPSTGCSNSVVQQTDVYDPPIANAGTDITITTGNSTTLSGSATGAGNYGWLWTPASFLVDNTIQNPTTVTLTSTQEYILNVSDTITGCSTKDTMLVIVGGGPLTASATATNTTICEGTNTQLNVIPSGGTGSYTYGWVSTPAGFTSAQQNPTVSPTVTTTYTVTVVSGAQNVVDNVVITVNPAPIVSITGLDTAYCINGAVDTLKGLPLLGSFTGSGMNGNLFDPAVAGVGSHDIIYTYTDPTTLCVGDTLMSTMVYDVPVANAGIDINLSVPGVASLSGSATGGTGSYSYLWSPQSQVVTPTAASTNTVSLSSTTQFTLMVTDNGSGCADSDDMIVNVGSGNLSVSVNATPDTLCAGSSSSLVALASGGNVGSYTYAWSSNPVGFTSTIQNPTVTPSVTTTYTVTVNDGTSNANASIVLVVNPLPVVSISNLASSYCSNVTPVSLSGTPAGGLFSGNGITGNTFYPASVSPGNQLISYSYTDMTTGCSNSVSQSTFVYEAPNANAGTDVSISLGSDTILYGSATGGGNYAWAWQPALMLLNASQQEPTTVALTSTQLFTLTVTDTISGCSDNDDVIVYIGAPTLSATILPNKTTMCEGDSAQLNVLATGGSGSYNYNWTSIPMGFTSSAQNVTVKPTVTTLYSVQVTDGINSVTKNVTITVNPTPNVALIGLSGNTCANSAPDTLLGFPAGGTYSGTGITSNLFNPVAAGVGTHYISYTYTDANGCSNVDVDTVMVNANPIANAGTDRYINTGHDTILNGSALGGSGSYSFEWAPATELINAFAQNPTTKVLNMTTLFTLTVTDQNSGCEDEDTAIVYVSGGPLSASPFANPDTICYGNSTQLNAFVSGGTGVYSYLWSSSPAGFSSSSPTPTVTPATTTTFTVIVDDGNGTDVKSVVVVVETTPIVQVTSNAINCENGGFDTLVGSPAGGIFFGPGVSGNLFNPSVAGLGTHEIFYSYTTTGGCSNSDTISTQVVAAPVANAGSDIMIPCGGSGGLIGTNPMSGMLYNWTPSNGLSTPNMSNTIANPQVATLYTLEVTDTLTGCSSTDNVLVDIIGGPQAVITNDTIICKGETVTLTVSGGNSWLWSNGVTGQSFTISPNVTTTYHVTVSDGLCSDVDSVTVFVNAPYVDLGPDVVLIDTSSFILDAGYGFLQYLWNTGDTTQSILVEPYSNAVLGLNKYGVAVMDPYGCITGDSVSITYVLSLDEIGESLNMNLYPNPSDGQVTMEIIGTSYQSYTLDIMDLSGSVIYSEQIQTGGSKYVKDFDLRTWAKGVYFVRLASNGNVKTYKMVIH